MQLHTDESKEVVVTVLQQKGANGCPAWTTRSGASHVCCEKLFAAAPNPFFNPLCRQPGRAPYSCSSSLLHDIAPDK